MGLFSKIKAIGRAIDPTSSTAPLGSLVKSAISVVPGGAAVLGGVQMAGGIVGNPLKGSATGPAGTATPTPLPPAAPMPTMNTAVPTTAQGFMAKAKAFVTTPVGIGTGLLAVAGLLWLLLRRK